VTLHVSPRAVAAPLMTVVLALMLISMGANFARHFLGHDYVFGIYPRFNVGAEQTVPTWFGSMLLFSCACLLAVIGVAARAGRRRYAAHWLGLAAVFVFLSADEITSFHEMLTDPVRGALQLGGVFYFAWVIPVGIATALLGLFYARFLLHLPRITAAMFVIAGGIYIGGAIGMEMVGSWIIETQYRWSYAVAFHAEEFLEMAGLVVFLYAMLDYARRSGIGLEVRIERQPSDAHAASVRHSSPRPRRERVHAGVGTEAPD